MSAGMELLDRVDTRLQRVEANQGAIIAEVRRLSTLVAELLATPCARCRLQLAPTISSENDHHSDAEPLL